MRELAPGVFEHLLIRDAAFGETTLQSARARPIARATSCKSGRRPVKSRFTDHLHLVSRPLRRQLRDQLGLELRCEDGQQVAVTGEKGTIEIVGRRRSAHRAGY